jgi:phosphoglycolate phosphatase-like HAD superfamily hydrolase
MQAATGTTYDLSDIIVIGDTPKDIRCAAAFGARCLAVATGDYAVDDLHALQPWRTLPSFEDVSATVELLMR